MSERHVYLCGPCEVEGDTWRVKTAEKLVAMGFAPIDPLRNEKLTKVGKHVESDLTDKMVVRRDLNDLERTKDSGGLLLANLQTTVDGRNPMGALFEMMYAHTHQIPVISVLNDKCDVDVRTHPWVRYCTTYEATSLTRAVEAIELYFKD